MINRGATIPLKIFETIGKVANKKELFHTRFLADTLADSIERDESLFSEFWSLIAPPMWTEPVNPEIHSPFTIDTGVIDVLIRVNDTRERVVGIEIKVAGGSTEPGQLEKYRVGLEARFPDAELAIAYLTPFNRDRAGSAADLLRTIREFENFAKNFDHARHVSWLDVADIPWDGNELWGQHQSYVRNCISSDGILERSSRGGQNRENLQRAFRDSEVYDAVSRLLDLVENEDAKLWWIEDGVGIAVKCPLKSWRPISVAWIFPQGMPPASSEFRVWRGFRSVSVNEAFEGPSQGSITNYSEFWRNG